MSAQQKGVSSEDISYVLENPWEKSKEEWLVSTERERAQTLLFIRDRLQKTESDGYSKIWRTPDDKAIAILGAFKSDKHRYETFFICSEHMESNSIKISFDMRQILKDLSFRFKGCSCGQYAKSDRTDQISWFRFLGFKYKPEGNIGNTKYFEYQAPHT